ncbi:MAG: NAD(P)-dependent oxidoreductase [Actinomycetota bacterium]
MTVLVTGAAGLIGTMLRERLPALGWQLRLLDRIRLDGAITGDVADPAVLDQAMRGVDAVVHLAGQSTEAPWPAVRHGNVDGLFQLFEAARRHGVRRIVFASSNHAVGFAPRADTELSGDLSPRPDTLYGVSKAFGEALGRYYVDRYGMQVACLRIGTCDWEPPDERALATWLSPDDCSRLVDSALRAPDLGFALVWGVSANTRRWWSLDAGQRIGYEPRDDAEVFASRFTSGSGDRSGDLVGGGFTTPAYGIDEVAARG